MRTRVCVLSIMCLLCGMLRGPARGEQKLAQAGMKFLAVGSDPRAAALAEAFTSVEGNSEALFFNPAGMARLKGFTHVMVGQTAWIADIKHNFGSIALSPWGGDYGVLGFSIQAVDYGEINQTIRDGNPGGKGFFDLGTFKPTALMAGVGYARALSDKFSIGGNVKYVRQDLGETVNSVAADGGYNKVGNVANVFAFDFGILYRTGFKSLNFGMIVRNFSKEVQYQDESFQLPLTFKIGLSMNILDLLDTDREMHSFLVAVDAEHPRDYAEQIRVGGEYTYMNTLAFRFGYVGPADEQSYTLGVGVRHQFEGLGFGVDYAYTPFGIFDNVSRISFQFSF